MSNNGLIQRIRNRPQPSTPMLACSKLVFCIIPVAQIAIGAKYLDDCPRQHYIPIYLIVVGVFSLVLAALSCLPCARTPEDGTPNPLSRICTIWNSQELRKDLPSPSVFQCFLPQPTVVTKVHLRRASGLGLPKHTAPDVYAIVRCENDTIRTQVFKAEGNPEFNLRAVFYRRYPGTPISIELWSRGRLWDSVLGEARLQTAESERSRSHVIDLRGGQSRSGCRGCVYVETSSSVCLTDL